MRINNKIIACFCLVTIACLLFRCTDKEPKSDGCLPDVADKYIYPIVPGMTEWRSINMYEYCQLPDSILHSISTTGLIRSFLDTPYSLHFQSVVSSSTAEVVVFDSIYSKHNSVQELLSRNDAANSLIAYYDAICFDCLNSLDVEVRWNFGAQMTALEFLFAKQEILNQCSSQEKKNIVKLLLDKYELYPKEGSRRITAMGLVMYKSDYLPIIQYYDRDENNIVPLLSGAWFSAVFDRQSKDIVTFAKQFVK
ncbi:hypothetical protein FACS1894201_09490 [Bacteroidia bacterium]|nr:hypothetical protein FACS1894201_09490 [Bacteroidia bacterium]